MSAQEQILISHMSWKKSTPGTEAFAEDESDDGVVNHRSSYVTKYAFAKMGKPKSFTQVCIPDDLGPFEIVFGSKPATPARPRPTKRPAVAKKLPTTKRAATVKLVQHPKF
jgi:hypothetical protein